MQKRLVELDALRGLMLLWITLTHLPTVLSKYVNQPFGYFAATEGFIFLSALFTGRIYFQIAERESYHGMCNKLLMRAGRLYCYQLLLLGFAFVIEAPLAAGGNRPAVHNLLDFYFSAGRIHAFVDAAFMIYRPPLLDILPIYIIFLALTPLALIIASRFGWKHIFAASSVLWLLAQFGLRDFVYHWMARVFDLHIALNQMGAFDLWAWQLWWVIGLWLGVRWVKGDLHLEAWAQRMTVVAAIVAACFLVLRYMEMAEVLDVRKFAFLLNKWDFGFGRIIDFAAVATLAIRFQSVLKPLAIRPLVMLGQASLPVFCIHLLCVFLALTIMGNNAVVSGWQAIMVVLLSLSSLLLTAKIAANRRARLKPGPIRPEIPIQPGPGYIKDAATRAA
jgi:hypothetical protein